MRLFRTEEAELSESLGWPDQFWLEFQYGMDGTPLLCIMGPEYSWGCKTRDRVAHGWIALVGWEII